MELITRSQAAVQLVSAITIVALVTVLAKQTLERVDYLQFVWLQMLIASTTMLIFTFIIKRERFSNDGIKVWLTVLGIGILNFAIVRAGFMFALDLLPATTHAYIINFVGIVTMFLSAILLKEPPTFKQFAGAVIALLGIRLYFWELPDANELEGIIWLLVAVVCLAMTNILMRYLHSIKDRRLSNNQVSTYAILFGTLPLLTWGLISQESSIQITAEDWLVIAANGIFSVCLVMLTFNSVLRVLKAYEASILASSGMIFTAVFSMILLKEKIEVHQFGGILLMIAGITMVQFFRHQHKEH